MWDGRSYHSCCIPFRTRCQHGVWKSASLEGGPESCPSFFSPGMLEDSGFGQKWVKSLVFYTAYGPALIFSTGCFCWLFVNAAAMNFLVPISGLSDWETIGKEILRLSMAALSGQTAISSSLQRQTLHLCCPYLKSQRLIFIYIYIYMKIQWFPKSHQLPFCARKPHIQEAFYIRCSKARFVAIRHSVQ